MIGTVYALDSLEVGRRNVEVAALFVMQHKSSFGFRSRLTFNHLGSRGQDKNFMGF